MVTIKMSEVYHIKDMVGQLAPIYKLAQGSSENVRIYLNTRMIYPEYLAMIVSCFKWAQHNDILLKITDIYYPQQNIYPFRINFFRLIGSNIPEPYYCKHSSEGKFVEITPLKFDIPKQIFISSDIVDKIIKIFRDNYHVEESIYKSMNYCIWEQIDNIQNHSGDSGEGYVVAQNYPKNKEIRLCVIDNGMGVYNSLTNSENSKYKSLSPMDAVGQSIEEGVTNGSGMGNGLYHSANFCLENRGNFVLYSGNYYIEIKDGAIESVKCGEMWPGTIVFQKIKTNRPVNYNRIFNNCSEIPTSVDECDDMLDGLWD